MMSKIKIGAVSKINELVPNHGIESIGSKEDSSDIDL